MMIMMMIMMMTMMGVRGLAFRFLIPSWVWDSGTQRFRFKGSVPETSDFA